VTDFRNEHEITAEMNKIDDCAVYWQVPYGL